MDQDRENLRLLAIFHYVVAGMAALFSLFPVIHLIIGIAAVTGRLDAGKDPGAGAFGWIFIIFAVVFIVAGLTFSACLALAGNYLKRYRGYTYCFVVAALACLFFPFGTVLGVCTIVVLSKSSVKRLFGREVSPTEVQAAVPR